MATGIAGSNSIGEQKMFADFIMELCNDIPPGDLRPRTNEVTLSLLNRAKEAGYSALVVTLDTSTIGWRPHDLERSYLPFAHGIGVQVGTSDPVFMARYNKQPITKTEIPFPYEFDKLDKAFEEGDLKAKESAFLGIEWMKEANSGIYRTWEDLRFLRDNWEGPLIVKGIQCLEVRNIFPLEPLMDPFPSSRISG